MIESIETLMGTGESRALKVSEVWEFCAIPAHTSDKTDAARIAAVATDRPRRQVIFNPAQKGK
jgi:hypothetical protein